jgi:type IV secretory pathway VirD2 relaxase
MNPYVANAVVAARQDELERQAGCCTPAAEHRRTTRAEARAQKAHRRFLSGRRSVCCA